MVKTVIEIIYEAIEMENDDSLITNQIYKDKMESLCNLEDEISKKLTGEMVKLFEEFDSLQSDINCITNELNFKNGFLHGFHIFLEGMDYRRYDNSK